MALATCRKHSTWT